MKLKTKLLLALLFCIFYIPGYFFLYKEIGKKDYAILSIIFGTFFTLVGIVGHSILLFEKQYNKLEKDKSKMNFVKLFLKILGTLFALGFGLLIIISSLFTKQDEITQQDLRLVKGTLKSKPQFKRGSKSSSYLHILLNEYPDYIFEPQYEHFVHYSTTFETDVQINDSIFLGISDVDYEKYIAKTKALSYTDKHINSNFMLVYYIEANKKAYYNPTIHNQLDKDDKDLGRYIWIIGLFPLFAIISIWFTELTEYLERNNYNKLLFFLLKLRRKKIL